MIKVRALFSHAIRSHDRFPVYAISVLFVLAMIGYLSRLSDSDLASTLQYDCYSRLASFPGPTSQTIGKAGGGPGTFWHVTDVKLRRSFGRWGLGTRLL